MGGSNLWAHLILIGTRGLLRPGYSKLQILVSEPLSATGEDWQAALQLREAARQQILARLGEPDAC